MASPFYVDHIRSHLERFCLDAIDAIFEKQVHLVAVCDKVEMAFHVRNIVGINVLVQDRTLALVRCICKLNLLVDRNRVHNDIYGGAMRKIIVHGREVKIDVWFADQACKVFFLLRWKSCHKPFDQCDHFFGKRITRRLLWQGLCRINLGIACWIGEQVIEKC